MFRLICCLYLSITFSNAHLVEDILDSLELALSFYANNYQQMNLDGIFGLRLIEGWPSHVTEPSISTSLPNIYTSIYLRLYFIIMRVLKQVNPCR